MEIGKQSIRLEEPVYVESWASVVGKKEGEGPLAVFFDEIETDDQLGQNTWEEAESMLQQKAARLAVKKAGCTPEDIRIIFVHKVDWADELDPIGLLTGVFLPYQHGFRCRCIVRCHAV